MKTNVEVYSVDKCFLEVSMIEENRLADYALQMREIVEQRTGVSVSVGIEPTKTLAKIANHLAKKNKVETKCVATIIKENDIREVLKKIKCKWNMGCRKSLC